MTKGMRFTIEFEAHGEVNRYIEEVHYSERYQTEARYKAQDVKVIKAEYFEANNIQWNVKTI